MDHNDHFAGYLLLFCKETIVWQTGGAGIKKIIYKDSILKNIVCQNNLNLLTYDIFVSSKNACFIFSSF